MPTVSGCCVLGTMGGHSESKRCVIQDYCLWFAAAMELSPTHMDSEYQALVRHDRQGENRDPGQGKCPS